MKLLLLPGTKWSESEALGVRKVLGVRVGVAFKKFEKATPDFFLYIRKTQKIEMPCKI